MPVTTIVVMAIRISLGTLSIGSKIRETLFSLGLAYIDRSEATNGAPLPSTYDESSWGRGEPYIGGHPRRHIIILYD